MSNDSGGGWVVVALIALGLYTCSDKERDVDAVDEEYAAYEDEVGGELSAGGGYSYYSDEEAFEEREPFDEDAARDAAEDELASESYSSIGRPYGCTVDCSGHDAGYAWAAEGNIDGGISSSQSFDEGQQAFEEAVNDRVEEMRDAYESGEEPY